jgi:hypothetical protein
MDEVGHILTLNPVENNLNYYDVQYNEGTINSREWNSVFDFIGNGRMLQTPQNFERFTDDLLQNEYTLSDQDHYGQSDWNPQSLSPGELMDVINIQIQNDFLVDKTLSNGEVFSISDPAYTQWLTVYNKVMTYIYETDPTVFSVINKEYIPFMQDGLETNSGPFNLANFVDPGTSQVKDAETELQSFVIWFAFLS